MHPLWACMVQCSQKEGQNLKGYSQIHRVLQCQSWFWQHWPLPTPGSSFYPWCILPAKEVSPLEAMWGASPVNWHGTKIRELGLCSSLAGNPGLVEREELKLQERKEQHERKKALTKTGTADKRNSLKLALLGSNHFWNGWPLTQAHMALLLEDVLSPQL